MSATACATRSIHVRHNRLAKYMAKLFTVRMKNEPGALARLAAKLGEHGIDIRTIGVGAVCSHGCAVLSTNNDSAARDVLRKARHTFVEGGAPPVGPEDPPGRLAAPPGPPACAAV